MDIVFSPSFPECPVREEQGRNILSSLAHLGVVIVWIGGLSFSSTLLFHSSTHRHGPAKAFPDT